MGNQARLKAARRTARVENSRTLQVMHTETAASPEYQQAVEESQDEGVAARIAADLRSQRARLQAAGYRRRDVANDGAGMWDHRRGVRVLHSVGRERDGLIWAHVSVSHKSGTLPGWYEVRDAQWLFYPERTGLIVVAPETHHVDLAEIAHVWTCLSGDVVPDFRHLGQV